jgi:hypothetical protein
MDQKDLLDALTTLEPEVRIGQQELVARAPGSEGLSVDLEPGHSYWGRPRARIGDLAFDDRFLLKTNDLPFARAWLSPGIRDALLREIDLFSKLKLSDGNLELVVYFNSPDEVIQRASELARLVARRGQELLDEWRRAAEFLSGKLQAMTHVWTANYGTSIEVKRMATSMVIDACRKEIGGEAQLCTRIRAPRVTLEKSELVIDRGSSASIPSQAARIAACDPERIMLTPQGVTILLVGFVSDAERLGKACDLVAALAEKDLNGGSMGPYR